MIELACLDGKDFAVPNRKKMEVRFFFLLFCCQNLKTNILGELLELTFENPCKHNKMALIKDARTFGVAW